MIIRFGMVEKLTEVLVRLHHLHEELTCTIISLFTLVMAFTLVITALLSQRLAASRGRALLAR